MAVVKNEIGNKYGRLTVIERAENNTQGNAQWVCQCECGSLCVVLGRSLRSGNTKSCGCLQREKAGKINFIEETGNKYGRLTVISRAEENNSQGGAQWLCKCDCGSLHIVSGSDLRKGHTQSCGCIKSVGESVIAKILTENNIEFKREYIFSDLKGTGD